MSADRLINFINCHRIHQGEHLGEHVQLMGWQRRLIRGLYADETRTAALTVARGNGKTSLAAWIASAYLLPGAPLHRQNGQVVVVASSIEQGRLLLQKVVDVLPDGHNGQVWQLWNSAGACRVTHRETGANLKVFGSKASTIHGIEPILAISDEGSQWEKGNRQEIANAITTSLGKVPGSRALWIGTQPESGDNPFSKMLDGQSRLHPAP